MYGYGQITFIHIDKKPLKSMCEGCPNNSDECESFKTAKVVDKKAYLNIYSSQMNINKKETLSCYYGKQGQ